jgi:hypothetical protein
VTIHGVPTADESAIAGRLRAARLIVRRAAMRCFRAVTFRSASEPKGLRALTQVRISYACPLPELPTVLEQEQFASEELAPAQQLDAVEQERGERLVDQEAFIPVDREPGILARLSDSAVKAGQRLKVKGVTLAVSRSVEPGLSRPARHSGPAAPV